MIVGYPWFILEAFTKISEQSAILIRYVQSQWQKINSKFSVKIRVKEIEKSV